MSRLRLLGNLHGGKKKGLFLKSKWGGQVVHHPRKERKKKKKKGGGGCSYLFIITCETAGGEDRSYLKRRRASACRGVL